MTFPAGQDDLSAVCPYLGLADDADSHATYPTEAHRCYRLDNPTRIATGHQETYCLGANHVTCPVYRGEGIGATTGPAAGAAAAMAPPERAPRGGGRPPREAAGAGRAAMPGARGPRAEGEGRSPALERRRPAGSLGPRPRAGGISMPVATIGLFALAIVVLALAFLISRALGGGDGGTPAGSVLDSRTATQGGQANQTPSPAPGTATRTTTPPAVTPTTGTATTTATPNGAGAGTYTVQSGDTCSGIAQQQGITVDQLRQLNPSINEGCTNLNIGQVLRTR